MASEDLTADLRLLASILSQVRLADDESELIALSRRFHTEISLHELRCIPAKITMSSYECLILHIIHLAEAEEYET